MSEFQVDLTNCDREPIHIPGQVQSHGFLIVLDKDCTIRFFSDNVPEFVKGISTDLLGKPLQYIETFLGLSYQPDFIGQLIRTAITGEGFERTNPVPVEVTGKLYYLIISKSADLYLLEFEPGVSDRALDIQNVIGRSISEMLSHKNLQLLFNHTATQVKNIIQYDRVMIYRFADDGHGEVVAEAKNKELESWLGLHYPASDIPKQARELYKLNLTRLIADVNTTPSKITTSADTTLPLDLTFSQLRAVSPIHIQYLKNMGVASSFSISLIYKNELWGLIACHSYTPRFIDYRSREYAKLIGQVLSSALEYRQNEGEFQSKELFKSSFDELAKDLQHNGNIEEALTGKSINLLNLVDASGAVLVYDKNRIKLGTTISDEQLDALMIWIKATIKEPVYYTSNLSKIYPLAATYQGAASGILISVISMEMQEYVIWFKPEVIRSVKWAGDPDKPIAVDANSLTHISPRHSFAVWTQTVSGTAQNWSEEEIKSAIRIKEEINYAINQRAGAVRLLNERLRLAYEELDTFSYTISHDLKNPISAIKSYAQLLTRDQTIAERGQTMLQRITDRADQMNLMINAVLDYSRLGRSEVQYRKINTAMLIADIIDDLKLIYDVKDLRITIGDTPHLYGDPIMMLQVFSNLIGNAVKYSQRSTPAIVHIEGKKAAMDIHYTITDNVLGIAAHDIPKIFDLFNRMDNVKDIEGSGVGLAIVKRIVEKHKGRIWAESKLNEGSKFSLAFTQPDFD